MDSDHVKRLQVRLWIFLALTVFLNLMMRWLSNGLSGASIVEFEIAKSAVSAQHIMEKWDGAIRERFLWSIYVDYVFLCAYSGLFYYGSRYSARKSGQEVVAGAGTFFAWLGPLAGLMDVMENSAMLYTIQAEVRVGVVHFTYDMAVLKFSLLLIVALYIVVASFFRMINALSRKS
jgi:hypothetical protein